MAENWRVSVAGRGAMKIRRAIQLALVRSGLSDETTVSDWKAHVFIYARTSEVAEKAECVAQQALAELGRSGECQLEQWDSSSQDWRDVRSGLPAAEKATVATTRADKVVGGVANTVVGAVIETLLGGP